MAEFVNEFLTVLVGVLGVVGFALGAAAGVES